ncbi:MAG: iron ABC transporter permease [Actinomycetota bacterium]
MTITPDAPTDVGRDTSDSVDNVERQLGDRASRAGWPLLAIIVAVLVVVPVSLLAASILDPNVDVWRQQWRTRLPGQLVDTAVLLAGVAVGSLVLGCSLAWLVSAYRFPGSRWFAWLLIAPLAMPSYVLGFVTLSVIGFTGPIQGWWRDVFGDDAWFPPVRSMGGAIVVFTLVLYPYVFLLARAALSEQAGSAYDVARSLGAGPLEAARRVVLPLLRPALAAGVSIVMMETLTDFATVQYFGIDTVSVGVFRIWRGTFDRDAASEFATLVLVVALLVIGLERALRGRARFGEAGGAGARLERRRLTGGKAIGATAACSLVLLLSFGLPTAQLVSWAIDEATGPRGTPLVDRFVEFLQNSVILAVLTSTVCVIVALGVTNARRFSPGRTTGVATRMTAIGYAVPGPVVAIGVVLALVQLDDVLEWFGLGLPGVVATGSIVGLVYAYSVRFLAPGLNTIEAGLDQVPEAVTSSARSLGARPGTVARRIHLPLSRASILTGAVLVAVDSVKELPIALLLRPIGFDTLPVWTYNLASESRFEQAALPAIAIIVVALVPVAVLSRQLSLSADRR